MRCALAVLLVAGACTDAPRLTSFGGLAIERDSSSVALDVRVGDTLLIDCETTDPAGRDVWVWSVEAPAGWSLDPATGLGRWEVLAGTPDTVLVSLLVAAGPDGRGPGRVYSVFAEVNDASGEPDSDTSRGSEP